MNSTDTENEKGGFWVSPQEKQNIEDKLVSIADFQRLSSLLVWLGLLMVILHIGADVFFHIIG